MSALSVAAVVVSHAKPEYLKTTLSGLSAQSLRPKHVIVVETAADQLSMDLARNAGFQLITPGNLSLNSAINAALDALPKDFGWIWILHEDSAPELGALHALAQAAEISPSVAIIGPKLLHWDDPRRIQQLGLTATKSGKPFLLVADQYDQGQHDSIADTLSASTAGMLIALDAWQNLGGLDEQTPIYAADLELGLRARAAGYRVMVEPSARISHAGLSMSGERTKSWTGGSRYVARAKAHIHIATTLLPLPMVVLLYLAMPAIVLAGIPYHLWTKRPGRILGQLAGWLWAWSSVGQRFAARARTRSLGSLSGARTLLASAKQIRQRKLDALIEMPDEPKPLTGLFVSNQAWFALLPLILSFKLWPQGAIFSEHLAPLSNQISEIFASTAAFGLPIGSGLDAPTDPFNWILLAIAAISPLGSDWAIGTWLFIAPALAYFIAWQFAAAFLSRPWLRTLVALGYSLSPFVLGQALQGNLVELTAALFGPLALLFGYRAVQSQTNARALRWAGLAAISFFGLATSAPSLAALAALILVSLGVSRPRRLVLQLLSLVPGVLAYLPWLSFWMASSTPELALSTSWATTGQLSLELAPWSLVLALAALFALFGLVRASAGLWFGGLSVVVGALAVAYFEPSNASPQLGLALLVFLTLGASGIKYSSKAMAVLTAAVFSGTVALGAYQAWEAKTLEVRESRLMPALVVAQAQANLGDVLTLKISQAEQIEAELIWGDGLQLEQRSVASKHLQAPTPSVEVAQLTAALLAGNSDGVADLVNKLEIGFILLNGEPSAIAQTEVAIGSMEFLQPAGKSEFGTLWRTEVDSSSAPETKPDPLRQEIILSLLIAALLALPSPAVVRGYRRSRRGEE